MSATPKSVVFSRIHAVLRRLPLTRQQSIFNVKTL